MGAGVLMQESLHQLQKSTALGTGAYSVAEPSGVASYVSKNSSGVVVEMQKRLGFPIEKPSLLFADTIEPPKVKQHMLYGVQCRVVSMFHAASVYAQAGLGTLRWFCRITLRKKIIARYGGLVCSGGYDRW